MNPRIHPSLLANMRQALLAEMGACAIYARLARRTPDAELGEVLGQFHREECEQIEALRHLMSTLGARSKARSLPRSTAAWLIALSTRVGGMPLALRLCLESERTVERWYCEFAHYLGQSGERDLVATCEALACTKGRHARALAAWVER